MKALSLALFLFAGANAVHANPWEPQMDLLSAGAAASVAVHHACGGSSQDATQAAARRLQTMATTMPDPEGAYRYASNAFDMKVKAMWQSTDGACRSMGRLRDIARSTGFALP